jgi:NitT/TauT family transport system permease protein
MSGAWFKSILSTKPALVLSPLLFVVIVAAWSFVTRYWQLPEFVLPPPNKVWNALVFGLTQPPSSVVGFWYHGYITMIEALAGFAIGSVTGIVVGIAVAHFRLVEQVLYPYIVAFQSLPKVAVAPLFVIWFGFGLEPKILITSVITFFPLLVNTMAGYRSVDVDRLDLARSLNASPFQIIWKIRIPSALPFIFAGLNMAAVLSILGAIVGEFVGAQAGLGILLLQFNSNLNIAGVYALFIVLAAIGFAMHQTVRLLERYFCFWAQASTRRDVGM